MSQRLVSLSQSISQTPCKTPQYNNFSLAAFQQTVSNSFSLVLGTTATCSAAAKLETAKVCQLVFYDNFLFMNEEFVLLEIKNTTYINNTTLYNKNNKRL